MKANRASGTMHIRILESALKIFSLKGYADATIKDISSDIGCNAITIFRHFEDKEKLFYSVVEQFHSIDADEDGIKAQLCYSNLRKDLATLADIFFEIIFKRIHILRIFINEGAYFKGIHKYVWFIPSPLRNIFINYLNTVYPGGIAAEDSALIAEVFLAYIIRQCLRYSVDAGLYTYTKEIAGDFKNNAMDEVEFTLYMIMSFKEVKSPEDNKTIYM